MRNSAPFPKIDGYRIRSRLGEGGMGVVYRARDPQGRDVALKVIHGHLSQHQGFRAAFARQTAVFLNHPNIVQTYDVGRANNHFYLSMAYHKAGSLADYLQRLAVHGNAASPRAMLALAAQIAEALDYAQRQGVVHGSLEPSNVLLSINEANRQQGKFGIQAVVADFGMASMLQAVDETAVQNPLDSVLYMAPELLDGASSSVKTDLYALGVMLYQMLTGQFPYTGRSAATIADQHRQAAIPDPRQVRPNLPAGVVAVLHKLLAKAPYDRLASGSIAARALNTLSKPPAVPPPVNENIQITHRRDHDPFETLARFPSKPGQDDYVVVLHEDGREPQLPSLVGDSITIGRDASNDIRLDDPSVSDQHARLEREQDGWRVVDLHSDNGTWLGQEQLLARASEKWPRHQTLRIGSFFLRWRGPVRNAPPPGAAPTVGHRVDLLLQPDPATLPPILPGQSATISIVVHNRGTLNEDCRVALQGLHPSWAKLSQERLDLMPGEHGEIFLTIAPPATDPPEARTHTFQIRALATAQNILLERVSTQVAVGKIGEFVAGLDPTILEAPDKSYLTLTNGTNAYETYFLTGALTRGRVYFELLQNHSPDDFYISHPSRSFWQRLFGGPAQQGGMKAREQRLEPWQENALASRQSYVLLKMPPKHSEQIIVQPSKLRPLLQEDLRSSFNLQIGPLQDKQRRDFHGTLHLPPLVRRTFLRILTYIVLFLLLLLLCRGLIWLAAQLPGGVGPAIETRLAGVNATVSSVIQPGEPTPTPATATPIPTATSVPTPTSTPLPVCGELVAAPEAFTLREDERFINNAISVLANDVNPDFDNLTAIPDRLPTKGTLILNPLGLFTYDPNDNESGEDSFSYSVTDGRCRSAPAVVTLTIEPVNDVPVGKNDAFSTEVNTPLEQAAPGVLENDGDADEGDFLQAILTEAVEDGELMLQEDGSFDYTPPPDFMGEVTFAYVAFDGSARSEQIEVTIIVGAEGIPPRGDVDTYALDEDALFDTERLELPSLLDNDSDDDPENLTAVLVTFPQQAQHFELKSNGHFVYQSRLDYSGSDSFMYRAKDSTTLESAPITVTLTITSVNDAPIAVAEERPYEIEKGGVLVVPARDLGVLANDTDVDNENALLQAELVTETRNGKLEFDEPTGTFTYTPLADFTGTDTFSYVVKDHELSSANSVIVFINVGEGANAPPEPRADEHTIPPYQAFSIDNPNLGVLANDADADNDPLTAQFIPDSGVHGGTLALNPDGTFIYTPQRYVATDSFTYEVHDGWPREADYVPPRATITFNITTPFIPVDDAYAIVSNTSLTDANVRTNDVDNAPGQPWRVSLVTNVPLEAGNVALQPNGAFTYTPATNFVGNTAFTYRVDNDDFISSVATVTLTVSSGNLPPVANDDVVIIPVRANDLDPLNESFVTYPVPGVLDGDSDPEGDRLTAVLAQTAQHGQLLLDEDGSFIYTTNVDLYLEDSFTYFANDGTSNSVLAATVTIEYSDLAPPLIHEPTLADRTISTDGTCRFPSETTIHATIIERQGPFDEEQQPVIRYRIGDVVNEVNMEHKGNDLYEATMNDTVFGGVTTATVDWRIIAIDSVGNRAETVFGDHPSLQIANGCPDS